MKKRSAVAAIPAAFPFPYGGSVMELFDLGPITAKLCHPTRGLGWPLKRAERAVEQYRRWLWLVAVYPDVPLPPTRDVDQVWHVHILDTAKYAEDCQVIFGRLLHHNPYAGWESAEAEAKHQADFKRMKALHARHFGESLRGRAGLCVGGYCDKDVGADTWRPTSRPLRQAA